MATVAERLATLEAEMDGLKELVNRNYDESRNDHAKVLGELKDLKTAIHAVLDLFSAVKGIRWLLGLMAGLGALLGLSGLRAVIEWLHSRL